MKIAAMALLISVLPAVGAEVSLRSCADCHSSQAKPHPSTAMAQALRPAPESTILLEHRLLTFNSGSYDYRIERDGAVSSYTVSGGGKTIRTPLLWAFGKGELGQTYVYSMNGQLYQSRVSFYRSLSGLGLTMGAEDKRPKDLEEAAGLPMDSADSAQCFGCHATNAIDGRELTLDRMTPGVQCERCHGAAGNHVDGLRTRNAALARMPSLRNFTTEEQLNFCGQCHRTWEQIAASPGLGKLNVRFQPYRLTNSKCYDADDRRIACTACHDPHRPLNHAMADYDGQCLACHAGGKPAARGCKAAMQSNCSSCHMPKVNVPGAHHSFTDHQIRIVRANAPYPE